MLDPFFGSGTTGAVARRLNRHFIGIEQDPGYAALARERIRNVTPIASPDLLATQPKRAKHCHTCNRCVHRLDHHCLWLGNCVGEGNHRLFIAYLIAQGTLLGWAAFASIFVLLTGQGAGGGAIGASEHLPLPAWSCIAALGCCVAPSLAVS